MGQMKKPNVKYDNYEAGNSYDDGTMNTKDFLIGALVGGLVGAATALFMAPKSGKELREDFNSQAGTLKERASGWTEMAKEKGTNLATAAKDKTSTLSQSVQEQSGVLMDKVKTIMPTGNGSDSGNGSTGDMMDKAKETASSVKESVSQKLEETKKAFDQTEKSLSGTNGSSSKSQSNSANASNSSSEPEKSSPSVYANPTDVGVDEKAQGAVIMRLITLLKTTIIFQIRVTRTAASKTIRKITNKTAACPLFFFWITKSIHF